MNDIDNVNRQLILALTRAMLASIDKIEMDNATLDRIYEHLINANSLYMDAMAKLIKGAMH